VYRELRVVWDNPGVVEYTLDDGRRLDIVATESTIRATLWLPGMRIAALCAYPLNNALGLLLEMPVTLNATLHSVTVGKIRVIVTRSELYIVRVDTVETILANAPIDEHLTTPAGEVPGA
jgi:hypothetical protein